MKKELPLGQSVNFTVEILARRGWHDISRVLKGEKKKKSLQLKYSIQEGYHSEIKEK